MDVRTHSSIADKSLRGLWNRVANRLNSLISDSLLVLVAPISPSRAAPFFYVRPH